VAVAMAVAVPSCRSGGRLLLRVVRVLVAFGYRLIGVELRLQPAEEGEGEASVRVSQSGRRADRAPPPPRLLWKSCNAHAHARRNTARRVTPHLGQLQMRLHHRLITNGRGELLLSLAIEPQHVVTFA